MIKVLAIGNSFSEDATRYLHDIAEAGKVEMKVVNVCIGGCSLLMHADNIKSNDSNYFYQLNGVNTERVVSIKDAILEDEWDFVTIQQVSHQSGILSSYYPYFKIVYDFIEEYSPKSEKLIHKTWAYELDSSHQGFFQYNNDSYFMYKALSEAYSTVANEFSLKLIPVGDIISTLRKKEYFNYPNGGKSLCRDGFHLDLIYGRYAAAATWYKFLTKKPVSANSFVPNPINGEAVDKKAIKLIQQVVDEIV